MDGEGLLWWFAGLLGGVLDGFYWHHLAKRPYTYIYIYIPHFLSGWPKQVQTLGFLLTWSAQTVESPGTPEVRYHSRVVPGPDSTELDITRECVPLMAPNRYIYIHIYSPIGGAWSRKFAYA